MVDTGVGVHAAALPDGAAGSLADGIRRAGLKATAPRIAVLRALNDSPHTSAERLFAAVRTELPGTSLQAVYGVLAAFTTAGLTRKIELSGSPALFERRVGDNHHHVVCTRCAAVRDVDCAVGETPCLEPSDASGFTVHAAEVTYWGLCPNCQAELAAGQRMVVNPADTPTTGTAPDAGTRPPHFPDHHRC